MTSPDGLNKRRESDQKPYLAVFSLVITAGPAASERARRSVPAGPEGLLLVGGLGGLDQVGADFAFELLPHRLHGFTPLGTLLGSQGDDFGGAGSQDALLVAFVQLVG